MDARAPRGLKPVHVLTFVSLLAIPACDGGGRLDFISTQMRDLTEEEPLITTFHPGQCFWNVDADGFLEIGLHYENIPLFGPLSGATLDLSFELDQPPAGSAKTYQLRAREVRGRAELGAVIHRFRSLNGVISVWVDSDTRIHGRFRMLVGHDTFTILTDWRPAAPLLIVGEFDAVKNALRFAEINAAAQVEDWERPARRKVPFHKDYGPLGPPASRPATDADERHGADDKPRSG